jgi:hypothetical protein
VSVFIAEVGYVAATRFEDPQAEQAQHRDEREVVVIHGSASRDDHRLELEMRQTQGRRLGRNAGPAHVRGR